MLISKYESKAAAKGRNHFEGKGKAAYEAEIRECIATLPEKLQDFLWQDRLSNEFMFNNAFGGALGVAKKAVEVFKQHPEFSAERIYIIVLDEAQDTEAKYYESRPVHLSHGAFSNAEQKPTEVKKFRSRKNFVEAGMLALTTAILTISLVACNNTPSTDQPGPGDDPKPPIEEVTIDISDIFNENVNLAELTNLVQQLAEQKILSSIAGAENVNYLTDRTAIVEMADGTSFLFDITAAFSAEDKSFLENIADAIYAAANLDPDAIITEAQEQATIQALKAAAQQFAADAEQIIQNVSVDFVQLPQVDQSVELRGNISEFAGFEQVVFSPMTESMAFTSEGNLESENCTMSYAFGINADGSITAFVVTYADNGETAQEKIDNLANPGAAIISEVGTFPAGVDFSSQLPQLVQAPATISADTLYNQVFGEDYNFTKFDEFFQNLTDDLFQNAQSYYVLFSSLNNDGFKIYANAYNGGANGLWTATYNGQFLPQILDYYQFSSELGADDLKTYVVSLVSENIPLDSQEFNEALAIFTEIKNNADEALAVVGNVSASNFLGRTEIRNTSTNIEFVDFAKQFIPNGTEPVFCYVGPMKGRNMESLTNPYFNTGYYNQFDLMIGYIENNQLKVEYKLVVVPQYTNSTNETLYASALGELNSTYKTVNEEQTVFESPILTGATSGIEAEAEAQATR